MPNFASSFGQNGTRGIFERLYLLKKCNDITTLCRSLKRDFDMPQTAANSNNVQAPSATSQAKIANVRSTTMDDLLSCLKNFNINSKSCLESDSCLLDSRPCAGPTGRVARGLLPNALGRRLRRPGGGAGLRGVYGGHGKDPFVHSTWPPNEWGPGMFYA